MNNRVANRIVALVPMRHDSERVPAKNRRAFLGRPLYTYIINTLIKSKYMDRIIVDTDSEEIKKCICEEYDRKIEVIDRPRTLLGGDTSMNEIIAHDISVIDAEYYLQTHCTNPLLRTETVDTAIECYLDHHHECDSLFTVTKRQSRLWNKDKKAINHDPTILGKTQDLMPVFEENSCIYLFSKRSFNVSKNRIGSNPLMYDIDRIEAVDIDNEEEFKLAEMLYKHYRGES
jgi:CMP-N-acetylneuraminic acid synthetase